MTPLAQDLFAQARELPAAERDSFLAQACGDDAELHLEVQRLLVDAERADSFFGDADGATLGAEEFKDSYAEKEGDVIGPYKLRQQIGEGGFGTVWMAEQSVPISRMVALKVIKAGMDTKQVLARFEAERQALAMMDHPHIAKVLDAGATATGRPWFAMELVKGIPITDYCDQAGLDTRERLALFRDVCSAINHAHQKGIIHRDIKPSNVMVTLHGEKAVVKVIDFGIAKATQGKLTDQTLFTRFEQFIGTPVYMSPEQASLSGLDIDTRSDIYALGILLYELLVGKPPFDAKTLVSAGYEEMRRIIREVEPVKPSSRLSTIIGAERTVLAKAHRIEEGKLGKLVEPDLDWIVMKAIEKDRTRRYETANAFAQDIVRFLADEAVTARPPSAGYQFRKFARRNKAALRVAAVIAGVLVTATSISLWLAVDARRAESAAEAARADESRQRLAATEAQTSAEAERQRAEILAAKNHEELLKMHISRGVERIQDGESALALPWMVKALELDRDHPAGQEMQRMRIAQVLRNVPKLVRMWTKPGLANIVKFNATGEYALAAASFVGSKSRDYGGVSVWHVPTGKAQDLGDKADSVQDVGFSPDGTKLAVLVGSTREILLWDLGTGKSPVAFQGTHPGGHNIVFSPDGAKLLSYGYDRLAKLWDAKTGEVLIQRFEINEGSNLRGADFSPDGRRVSISEYDGTVYTFDVNTGDPAFAEFDASPWCAQLRYSPDGRLIAVATEDMPLGLFNSTDGIPALKLQQANGIGCFDFSPNGDRIATGSRAYDSGVQIWDSRSGEPTIPVLVHSDPVSMLRFAPDAQHLATVSLDQCARIWDVRTGELVGAPMWHSAAIQSVSFHPSGRYILTGCADGTVRMWELPTPPQPSLTIGAGNIGANFALDRSGKHLVTGSRDGQIQVWDTSTGHAAASPMATDPGISKIDFVPNSNLLVVADEGLAVRLWNWETGERKGELTSPEFEKAKGGERDDPASYARFLLTKDGGSVVTAIPAILDGPPDPATNKKPKVTGSVVQVWNPATLESLSPAIEGPPLQVISISPDGQTIVTSHGSRFFAGHRLSFWSLKTGKRIGDPMVIKDITNAGDFSPDGRTFSLTTRKHAKMERIDYNTLLSWRMDKGEAAGVSRSWAGSAGLMRYDPAGGRIAMTSDTQIRLLDATSKQPVAPPMILGQKVTDTQFNPDGRFLCSIDGSKFLYIHEAATGLPVTVPIPHPGAVLQAVFTPDGQRVVTRCADGGVRFWQFMPETASIEQLTLRAELLSGHAIDQTGALSPLSTTESEKLWKAWIETNQGKLEEIKNSPPGS